MSKLSVNVNIGGVDGETHVHFSGVSAEHALKFLRLHDHEGSSVSVHVNAEEGEGGYELLRAIAEIERVRERNNG